MMNKFLLSLSLIIFNFAASAQTVFSVDGDAVSVKDFKRMYEKGQVDKKDLYKKESVDEYVDLFVNYKMKLKEAEALGIDKDPEVIREIAIYEDKLIRSEFDKNVMSRLLNEAEDRLNEEICMRHVLIEIPERYKGTPDTIYSYKQAMDVRQKYLAGVSFDELAKKTSIDIETKYKGGDLGCFTTLQLSSYELENQAYKMKKGEVSMPVKTRFGYHILNVTDRRPNNGIVSATQIFVRSNNTMDSDHQIMAQKIIEEAYSGIKNGNDFDEMSDWVLTHKDMSVSVDAIDEFTVGTYESGFENAIFALKKVGDVSKPVQTDLGWHIFRLDSKEPLPDMEILEPTLRDKISEDERYNIEKQKFGEILKKKYDFERNDAVIKQFQTQVASGISREGWILPTGFNYDQDFFTIGKYHYKANQFVQYVLDQHSIDHYRTFENYYSDFETNMLMDYHKHNLVKTDPEMEKMLAEYRDGIILFNLMQKEIWNQEDISAKDLQDYYKEHESNYNFPDEVLVNYYQTDNKANADKIESYLKKGKIGLFSLNRFLKRNSTTINSGTKKITQDQENMDGVDLSNIGSILNHQLSEDKFEVLQSKSVVKGKTMPFTEAKSRVLTDYQSDLESIWVEKLKQKYKVVVNKDVVETLYR